jgi:hypothetical protein
MRSGALAAAQSFRQPQPPFELLQRLEPRRPPRRLSNPPARKAPRAPCRGGLRRARSAAADGQGRLRPPHRAPLEDDGHGHDFSDDDGAVLLHARGLSRAAHAAAIGPLASSPRLATDRPAHLSSRALAEIREAPQGGASVGASGRIRTSDFRFRRPTLYPAELRMRIAGRGIYPRRYPPATRSSYPHERSLTPPPPPPRTASSARTHCSPCAPPRPPTAARSARAPPRTRARATGTPRTLPDCRGWPRTPAC